MKTILSKKYFVYPCLFLFFNNKLLAQEAQPAWMLKEKYAIIGGGFSYNVVRDKGQSPLLTKGNSFNFFSGNENKTPGHFSRFNIDVAGGNLTTKTGYDVTNFLFNIDYTYAPKIGKYTWFGGKNPITIYAGGQIQSYNEGRYYSYLTNNIIGYEINQSINAASQFSMPFNLFHKDYEANFNISLPLLTYSIRPNFTGAIPTGTIFNDTKSFFNNSKLSSQNEIPRIALGINIEQKYSNGNRYRYGYSFGAGGNNISAPMGFRVHTFSFAYVFSYPPKAPRKKKILFFF